MKLTLPQQDVYFEQLLYTDYPIYNIGAKILIEGTIEVSIFNSAYQCLINQHDAYRTYFFAENEEVFAAISKRFEVALPVVDFSEEENADEMANVFMQKEFVKPFDMLSGEGLHRFILVKVSSTKHYLFSVYHHIITDGWGTSLMFQRLIKNYNELLKDGKVTSTYPYSYKDFVKDDENYQQSEEYKDDKKYWVEKFDTLPENLFEKKETHNQINKSSRKRLVVERSTYNGLNTLANENKSSTFHLLLALLYTYFGRKHQNNDFAIGLPVLNRSKSVFKKTVGLFMGVAPLRLELNFEDTIKELVFAIKNQLRKDYRHQRFPLGKLIKELQVFQEKEKMFNITLSYEKQDYASNFENTKTRVIPLTHQSERVALAIYIREFDESEDVSIDFDYNQNYFDEESITQVTTHFECLLANVLDAPHKKLKDLEYLTKEEEHQLLHVFNNTDIAYPKDQTFLDVFSKQVKLTPNKIAVFDEIQQYSYAEIDVLSNRIGSYIATYSAEDEADNIGVLLERSATTLAVMLGILKAGKSFIPLDPIFPADRLQYIIDQSDMKLLICDQQQSSFYRINTLTLNDLLNKVKTETKGISYSVASTDTAYIIYTSGSTGNPKGVEIGHQSLLNFLLSMQKKPGIQKEDILFAVTTYSFDISILELFGPLISGATVYMVSNVVLKDPVKLIKAIEEVKPSVIQATPSFYQMLFNSGWKGNTNLKVLCGGDLLSEDLASLLLKHCGTLWNMYGPTETTIWSSVKHITRKEEASNIGMPIQNTQFYIVDSFYKPLPIESSGSLYIAGDGLAKGYFKASDLTKQKFSPNIFKNGTLFYATNDVAKWNSKGEVEFLGREDNQVKIRGYRIELGEIEMKLNALSSIKQAVVVARKQSNQDAFLVAYVIKENDDYIAQSCITALEKELPKYMVPYTFIVVDDFPLTPNKKVNRKILSEKAIAQISKQKEFRQPENELQKKLVAFWKDVLKYEGEISIDDNFFSLGGHSLNAVKLIHQIHHELQYPINLKVLFDFPTITSLSNYLATAHTKEIQSIPLSKSKGYYKITPSQHGIWLASQHKNRSIAYNMTSAFHIEGSINVAKINKTVQQLILDHEILRTNFIEREGGVYQKIKNIKNFDFKISVENSNKDGISEYIDQFVNEAFNLEEDLLLKMKLIQMNEVTAVLVFCAHHIVLDGWSLELFTRLFLQYYNNKIESNAHNKESIQYKDYAEWFNTINDFEETTPLWGKYLEDFAPKESFSLDFFEKEETYAGDHFRFELDSDQTLVLKSFLKTQKTTMHNFLITVLNILIFKLSKHDDIVLGTVNSGRDNPQLNSMIGMFVKTLPLRVKLKKEDTFNTVLKTVQETVLQLDNLQNIPEIYKNKNLFDVLVAFQNPDFSYQEKIRLKEAKLKPYLVDTKYSRVPLLFNFFETYGKLNGIISFNTGKYDKETIELIVSKYKKLLHQVITNPSIEISKLEILLDFEMHDVVDIGFNF
ncbi:surfactin family lipopeptide synthetase A [Aquimarina sp. MAR_2010_214]|uniref:non-ribosomal peptide synthetase n=1 Tax=Aquimarina sp. MAR_2010_214 TaxID=1250026 RepID=UPI000C712255|nr:non-ribosomal peptide synthetase [Aquimarina sp. MAR_2010_214]PKV49533.1 surfactin family lipopeptide synthetase A [Aquimarina sp. MAR_2010_214]